MGLVQRAKNMILSPKSEWYVVAAEGTAPAQIVTTYVLPLAAASAIAHFIGVALLMTGIMSALGAHTSMVGSLAGLVISIVMAVVSVFVLAFIVDALAPTFGGTKSMPQAVKVVAYSYTPAWVFGILAIIPFLGWLAALIGGLYGIYLLYLGLPKLMKSPQEKAVPYVVVVIVCAIVLWIVIAAITASVGMMFGTSALLRSSAPSVTYDRNSNLGKLEEFSRKMEAAGKKMEAAQKGGDPSKQMEAAMGALGTALSGGKGVDPLQLDQLKPFLPEAVNGLPRTAQSSDRGGVAGLMTAKVQGDYADNAGKRIRLEIVDTGGAAGLMSVAAWTMLAGSEREDDRHKERFVRDGERLVHEEVSKNGGTNKFTVVLAQRFIVEGDGNGVGLDDVKAAVKSVDLGKLESTK
jgi:hypothetical protein